MIVFQNPKKKVYQEAFSTKMLGLPRYNGTFDFSKKHLSIPTIFPVKTSSVDSKHFTSVRLLEKIDNSNVIYSMNRQLFCVKGRNSYTFQIPEKCKRLVCGGGKAYIFVEKYMYVYHQENVKMFEIEAIDLTVSPFNEVFVLTRDSILIFGENGLKEEFPYSGSVKFIHFYLFRELILTGDHCVFHLDLNKLKVDTLYVTRGKILSTVFKDRVYVTEGTRFTSINVEDKIWESIHINKNMKLAVGDTMLALYRLSGDFLFCDRLDITNNKGVMYDVVNFLGFFFVGDRSYFFLKDRFVMWNMGDVKTILLCREENKDYLATFYNTLDIIKEEYDNRRVSTAVFKPNDVFKNLNMIINSLTREDEDSNEPTQVKKRIRYVENRRGGF